jgi:putative chitinase
MTRCPTSRLALFQLPLEQTFEEFAIDTPLRQAAFLAQIAHESGELRYVQEIWGPTPTQLRYEGRRGLGNVYPGDGYRFMGRGLIQITGRANYEACGEALDLDLLGSPELLEEPLHAARSAGWYWDWRGINIPADVGDFERVTRLVNGGLNGFSDRIRYYERALEELGA